MTTKTSNAAEANLKGNAPDGMALSDAELKSARKEGAKEDAKEAAKDTHRALTDGVLPGEPSNTQYLGHDESQQYADYLELGIDAFEELVAGKGPFKPNDTQVYGLLALERNGKNRTPYVKAAMKKLGLKADELPGGGPAYTNDLTSITDL